MAYCTSKDGLKIFFRDQGKGAPVVLIHGWPLNSDMWENQELALLEAGQRVITYDRRGFGRSGYCADGYDYDTFASDLKDLIDHLGLTSVGLAGFSMGGGEIARYLSRFGGGRISGVALISSVVPFLLQANDNPEGVPAEALADMQAKLRADRHAFLTGFGKQFFGSGLLHAAVSDETLDWTAQMANQSSGVNLGEHRNPELLHELVGDLLRAPVGADFGKLAHDQTLNVGPLRFIVFGVGAVVSDFGVGQDDNLSGVGGVGENFLVAGDGSIKNDFAGALAFRAVAFASEDSAVFECKDCLHCNSCGVDFKDFSRRDCGLRGKSYQFSAVSLQ